MVGCRLPDDGAFCSLPEVSGIYYLFINKNQLQGIPGNYREGFPSHGFGSEKGRGRDSRTSSYRWSVVEHGWGMVGEGVRSDASGGMQGHRLGVTDPMHGHSSVIISNPGMW